MFKESDKGYFVLNLEENVPPVPHNCLRETSHLSYCKNLLGTERADTSHLGETELVRKKSAVTASSQIWKQPKKNYV